MKVPPSPQDATIAALQAAQAALQEGRAAQAWEAARAVPESDPAHAAALHIGAHALARLGRWDEAIESFRMLARLRPTIAEVQFALGSALAASGRRDEALKALREATRLKPDLAPAHRALGDLLAAAGHAREAVESYRAVEALGMGDASLFSNLGYVLLALDRAPEAEAALVRAVTLEPGLAPAFCNLGLARHSQGRLEEALGDYRRALALDPGLADAHANLALALWKEGRENEARESAARAEAIATTGAEALKNLGHFWREAGDSERALLLFQRAVATDPGHVRAHYGLGAQLLSRGQWREGWREYAWRSVRLGRRYPLGPDGWPEPLPASLAGRVVALMGEQGLGDILFFLRYAPELVRRGARLVYRGDPRLASMLGRAGIFDDQPVHDDAMVVHVGDLPYLLQDNEPRRPAPLPLAPLAERLASARERLGQAGPPPYVGASWRAGSRPRGEWRLRYFKYIEPALLGATLRAVDATVVVLQRQPLAPELAAFGEARGRPAADLSAVNDDLEDMLATLCLLDAYVTVSNTNVHLAAGLGKRCHVMVPHPPEWRWMESVERSDWFPGFPLYRAAASGDWDTALQKLTADLRDQAPSLFRRTS